MAETATARKAIIYCRVSDTKKSLPADDDRLLSLDNQALLCVEWCRQHGVEAVEVIHEIGSAREVVAVVDDDHDEKKRRRNQKKNPKKKKKRQAVVVQPLWAALMTRIETGPVKEVVVYNVTRFCRSVTRGIEHLDRLKNCGGALHLVQEGLSPLKDDAQRYQTINLLNLAELESKRIAERVEAIVRLRQEFGHRFGPPPYGERAIHVPLEDQESSALNQIHLLSHATETPPPLCKTKRVFVTDAAETCVISWIRAARTPGTPLDRLNDLLRQCTDETQSDTPFEPLELCGGPKKDRQVLVAPLSYSNIAAVLNDYRIPYRRARRWSAITVNSIERRTNTHDGHQAK